jgi:hypothetical protein
MIAVLRSLILPGGALSGQRIVLDGDAGTISFYDANDKLRIRLGFDSQGIEFFTGLAGESTAGLIYDTPIGTDVDATRRANMILKPSALGGVVPTIQLTSKSFDGTVLQQILLDAISGVGGGTIFLSGNDARFTDAIGTSSFVRRAPVVPAKITANQTGITVEADITGLSVTWTAVSNRQYKLTVQARGALLTTATIAGRCRVSITDSANTHVGGDCDIHIPVGVPNVIIGPVHDVAYVTGVSGSVTYKVRGAKVAGDAGATMTFGGAPGAGTGGASFTVEDLGIV